MKLSKYTELVQNEDGTVVGRIYSRKEGFLADMHGKPDDVKAWLSEQMKDAVPVNAKEVH
ncbi:MAG TPA: hypothetical protein VHI52_07200 [Verrucomicrobiae bacterium]|nr:hypothetical protein [Verrucomicrobiae bacterium]